ncbi:hypothetical protein GCM10025876_11960 [Demequina litorisediminis]|uniref:Ppx/GppA phosphatase N-terminal domain-containing protein n=1 Tax=Demequina litorisediminis TaxID=1849022 RepID=A0ABQ6IAW9_9MICO|nr:hypothetical protein GCM10025876_11960 [Demequina litorisediminis]
MTRVAAIDCGTNSIRLLIADVAADGESLTDVVRLMKVVRLGQGVDRTGQFAPEALERTLAATDEYAALCREHQVESIRFVATSATRDASNRDEFISGVRERLGVEPEVISGHEEAALSFRGAVSVVDPALTPPYLVVDLGGGSTEPRAGRVCARGGSLHGRGLRADDGTSPDGRPGVRRPDRGRSGRCSRGARCRHP